MHSIQAEVPKVLSVQPAFLARLHKCSLVTYQCDSSWLWEVYLSQVLCTWEQSFGNGTGSQSSIHVHNQRHRKKTSYITCLTSYMQSIKVEAKCEWVDSHSIHYFIQHFYKLLRYFQSSKALEMVTSKLLCCLTQFTFPQKLNEIH